jgi:hypothetical protein
MEAIVNKLSPTGKTMLVQLKVNKYQIGYTFGWASNPGCKPGDVLTDFAPKGQEPATKDGEIVRHKDGEPVMRWVF